MGAGVARDENGIKMVTCDYCEGEGPGAGPGVAVLARRVLLADPKTAEDSPPAIRSDSRSPSLSALWHRQSLQEL
jgi:hypothetical protein